jgi:hypothetical protein
MSLFHHRPTDAEDERAAFLAEDRRRRHAARGELQSLSLQADEAQVRVNELKAEHNARYQFDMGHRPPADDRGGGDAGHAGV